MYKELKFYDVKKKFPHAQSYIAFQDQFKLYIYLWLK